MATNLPEDARGLSYVKRPNGGAEEKTGNTGRYEIPSSTKKPDSYFGTKRRYVGSEPRSDATIPYRMVNK